MTFRSKHLSLTPKSLIQLDLNPAEALYVLSNCQSRVWAIRSDARSIDGATPDATAIAWASIIAHALQQSWGLAARWAANNCRNWLQKQRATLRFRALLRAALSQNL